MSDIRRIFKENNLDPLDESNRFYYQVAMLPNSYLAKWTYDWFNRTLELIGCKVPNSAGEYHIESTSTNTVV